MCSCLKKGVLNLLLDSFYYKEKGLFLQSLHPGAAVTLILVFLLQVLVFSHPLYLAGSFVVILLTIWAADGLKALKNYLKFALWVVLLVLAINPLVNQSGNTVLWQSPHLPLAGRLSVTLEAVLYGAAMGLRLLNIVVIFCLYNLIVHPDRILNMISRFAHKPALVISLSTRLLPVLAASLNNIREAQQLRGVDFSDGSLKKRVGRYTAMLNVLMISSLEDSLQIAEAMQARAFGSGPRSIYRRDLFRPRDGLCLAGSIFSLGAAVYCIINDLGSYTFFPQLGSPSLSNTLPS
jgi:energy-coupling factor transport system permease protein